MESGLSIRILTHNIRYAATSSQRFPNERPWSERLPGLIAELKYHTRQYRGSFICLQEALHGQLLDILHGLNEASGGQGDGERLKSLTVGEWTYYGEGRDDGLTSGEYNSVFYRQSKDGEAKARGFYWRKVHAETKWLSPTPDVRGSKGWDAASVRIVTVVVFEMGGEKEEEEEKDSEDDSNEYDVYRNQDQEWVRISKSEQPQTIPHSSFSPSSSSGQETQNQASLPPPYSQYPERQTHLKPKGRKRKRLLLLNTHLDDQGRTSRIESAKLLLHLIDRLRREWDVDAIVLAGDLNSEAPSHNSPFSSESNATSYTSEQKREGGKTSNPNKRLGARNPNNNNNNDSPFPFFNPNQKEEDKGGSTLEDIDAYTILNTPPSPLRDLRTLIPPKQRYGFDMTYTGFNGRGDDEGRCSRIDFIYVNTNTTTSDDDGGEKEMSTSPSWQVQGYAVLPNLFDDTAGIGMYMSDHRAVVGDLVMR